MKRLVAAAGAAIIILSIPQTTARAQSAEEAEMVGFHQLCEKGDRRACIKFGILLGRNQQRHADWRRAHADWFWWER
jgi:hypothetical protein